MSGFEATAGRVGSWDEASVLQFLNLDITTGGGATMYEVSGSQIEPDRITAARQQSLWEVHPTNSYASYVSTRTSMFNIDQPETAKDSLRERTADIGQQRRVYVERSIQ